MHPFNSPHPINALALVPLRLLPLKAQWQSVANALPVGTILFCPPLEDELHQEAWVAIRRSIRATGHKVFVVPAEYFLPEYFLPRR